MEKQAGQGRAEVWALGKPLELIILDVPPHT